MHWSDEAKDIFKQLMKNLPAGERQEIKEAAQPRAESLAEEENEDEVSVEAAILAVIESTPAEFHDRLRDMMAYQGIDPEDYKSAFGE
jgi:hypothetical protein